MTTTQQIKKLLKTENVKNSVRTYGRTIYVTIKSACSNELMEKIRSLDSTEAHGCTYDDTRYYTGTAIAFRFEAPVEETHVQAIEQIISSWATPSKDDHQGMRSIAWHIEKQVRALGFVGLNFLDARNLQLELYQRWGK